MSRGGRYWVLAVGIAAVGGALAWAFLSMPGFGGGFHPYRDAAVAAALRHSTANVVSSVNFDQRGFDTLGEETILLASVVGVAVLLRPLPGERHRHGRQGGHVLGTTRMLVVVAVPLTLVLGIDVVAHGAVTPGGGFQGGVVAATALHLIYVGDRYRVFARLRPIGLFEQAEAAGVVAYAAVGVAGLAFGGSWLANILPHGTLARLVSAGTVPLLNAAVGLAVAGSVVVLLSHFLDQRFLSPPPGTRHAPGDGTQP